VALSSASIRPRLTSVLPLPSPGPEPPACHYGKRVLHKRASRTIQDTHSCAWTFGHAPLTGQHSQGGRACGGAGVAGGILRLSGCRHAGPGPGHHADGWRGDAGARQSSPRTTALVVWGAWMDSVRLENPSPVEGIHIMNRGISRVSRRIQLPGVHCAIQLCLRRVPLGVVGAPSQGLGLTPDPDVPVAMPFGGSTVGTP
jgi:hypothetical protein